MMSKKSERMNEILNILKTRNGASFKYLASELGVSEMTIRRDLEILHANKLITLIQGVAIYNSHNNTSSTINKEYNLSIENDMYITEKEKIGQKAASLLEPDDVIIIDAGSTTVQFAKSIPDEMPLTVLCYTMNILTEVNRKSNCKKICAGGYYHANTQMFQSPEGIALISRTCANKAFISAAGISQKLNVTCMEQYEIETKKSAIKSADKKILLVDSTKFDKICPAMFASLSDFDTVITNETISSKWIKHIKEMDIDLMLV